MEPVASTAEILVFKVLNRDINKQWSHWAIKMLIAGYDNENLAILAGENEPYNQFELQRLTTKILNELNLKFDDENHVINNYACYLIDKALSGTIPFLNVLNALKELCIERDYDKELYDFYSLYFAKEDLIYSTDQSYWPNADRGNIDTIVEEYFIKYRNDCNGVK